MSEQVHGQGGAVICPNFPLSTYSWADQWARHYSYECTVTAQERPYMARPSRTQQLQNPKLMPKLSNETPNDLQRTRSAAGRGAWMETAQQNHTRKELDLYRRTRRAQSRQYPQTVLAPHHRHVKDERQMGALVGPAQSPLRLQNPGKGDTVMLQMTIPIHLTLPVRGIAHDRESGQKIGISDGGVARVALNSVGGIANQVATVHEDADPAARVRTRVRSQRNDGR
ncbi:hypothetical protein N7510_007518 [Penicillium lagena]|uniref:uncharacterized protein n=1 Tax=Penicillium lagena TaxID=94218 RepID=UPI0025403DE8|nr:uncharacterized protein N7510_007518 [Penicillium lagena]KAJ5610799.1 hypothetical protein N7510_007518 [Penicillium lagena]